jgi:hypothetical protein
VAKTLKEARKTIQQKIDRLVLKQAEEVLIETHKIGTAKSWIVYR